LSLRKVEATPMATNTARKIMKLAMIMVRFLHAQPFLYREQHKFA